MKRTLYFLGAVAAVLACVIIPYFAWHGTWFGRLLTDTELTEYLQDQEKSRRVQHALTQIAGLMDRRESSATQWYEEVIRHSKHPTPQVRVTAAWVMGQDPTFDAFHQALLGMLPDDELLVRRNAALALVRFGDPSGLKEIRAMLLPYSVRAPVDGEVDYLVSEGEEVHLGNPLVRVSRQGDLHEVRSPLSSSVQSLVLEPGTGVKAGTELLTLYPDVSHVWESLRALALVGDTGELEVIRSIAEDPGFVPEVRDQAILTHEAIESRVGKEADP
ncbi:MAG: HEAT repeat domain-containing protein [Acidobacteriota bacterium]